MRAVTLWSMFGNVDWRSLLTRDENHYDPGVFDARSTPPRPTVLAKAAKAMAAGERFDHPVLSAPGWWRRPEPFLRRAPSGGRAGSRRRALADHRRDRDAGPGPDAHCAASRARTCVRPAAPTRPWRRGERPRRDRADVAVGDHQRRRLRPRRRGRAGRARLFRRQCRRASTIFAVSRRSSASRWSAFRPTWCSTARTGRIANPTPAIRTASTGKASVAAELAMLGASAANLVVRTAAFFGPWDRHNFAWHTLQALQARRTGRGAQPTCACRRPTSPICATPCSTC